MPASISLTSGNVCESNVPLTSWPVCRAALSLYNGFRIDGDEYLGTENDEDWPKGCYYGDFGVWFNEHPSGSANEDASIICSQDLEPVEPGGTLLVGDSDIDYWLDTESVLTAETLQPVLNVGYGGYTCQNVLDEADEIIATLQPSRVVLVCGENDLAGGTSVEKTFTRYSNVVAKYVAAGAKVFSFSTKPEPESTKLHEDYEALDALIKPFTADGSLTFIDSYAGFNTIGNPSSGPENLYDSDGLHLSAKGYALWQTWLEIALENEESGCQVYTSGECVQGATDSPTNPPTDSPTNPPTDSPGFCFSGKNSVVTRDRGTIRMDQLRVGDYVLTLTANNNMTKNSATGGDMYYERVYSFGHYNPSTKGSFLQLNHELELTANHMLYIQGKGFIPAGAVQIGDVMLSSTEKEIVVHSIRSNIPRIGVYAPFTLSGTILVNDILTSAYIALPQQEEDFTSSSSFFQLGSWSTPFTNQWLSHSYMAPHRICCFWLGLPDPITDVEGVSIWAGQSMKMIQWILQKQLIALVGLFLLAIPFLMMLAFWSIVEETLLLVLQPQYSSLSCTTIVAIVILATIIMVRGMTKIKTTIKMTTQKLKQI